MIPYARFAFEWKAAGGRFYNVIDTGSTVYEHGSTLREDAIDRLGLPKVESDEDEIRLVNAANITYFTLHTKS